MTWLPLTNRKIDPVTRDYVIDSGGFTEMNPVSQRVYLALTYALSKITATKKTSYLSESTRVLIENALSDLIDTGLISEVSISVDSNMTGKLGLHIEFINNTINRSEALYI